MRAPSSLRVLLVSRLSGECWEQPIQKNRRGAFGTGLVDSVRSPLALALPNRRQMVGVGRREDVFPVRLRDEVQISDRGRVERRDDARVAGLRDRTGW